MCTLAPPTSLLPTPTSSSSSKKKETLSFLPSFSAQFLLFEGGEMLCSAVFVSVVRQKKALCVPSFTASHARKGKGAFFIWHLFPTCSIGWEMHSKNKRRLRTPPPPFPCCPPLPGFNHPVPPCPPTIPLFFQSSVSIRELYFWGLLTLSSVWGQLLEHGVNAACNLPQKPGQLICGTHTPFAW